MVTQELKFSSLLNTFDIFMCPACGGDLKAAEEQTTCLKCNKSYDIEEGVPLLFLPNDWKESRSTAPDPWPQGYHPSGRVPLSSPGLNPGLPVGRGESQTDVTSVIKQFYEATPFPNYDNTDDVGALIQKAGTGIFARLLNEQIPFQTKILEVGCGTGQLSNFLGIATRYVFGTDMSLNSLKLGQNFKIKNNLDRVSFYQMNLFRPIFKKESFDLVICNGVLHHTSDPFQGFQSIARLVKKGGYIIIGLYNKYGRLSTDLRRIIFKTFSDSFKFLDPRLKKDNIGEIKKSAWFLDQYKNPHESKHTIGEVLKWFERLGFEFVNSIPKTTPFSSFSEDEKLFKINSKGNWLDHMLVQLKLIFKRGNEGGFFLMIGKRKN